MLYWALRSTAAIALRWYYAEVYVQGRERVPKDGPLIVIANHPNALIDPLLVGTILPRRILLTAKATLFENPALALLLAGVGVVPLRRARDGPKDGASDGAAERPGRNRNADAFRLVTAALRSGQAVLVFPEGVSHDEPAITPLKSGAARMALQARSETTQGLHILPVGLIFEEKERPGSRVLVRIGEPLDLDRWADTEPRGATALTAELDARLRAVTLNFASAEGASRAVRLARTLAAIDGAPRAVDTPRSLAAEAEIALRVDAATTALVSARMEVVAAADALAARLSAMERDLQRRGVGLDDIRISPRLQPGLRFVLREGPLALIALVVASLGSLAHWIPLRLARAVALRSLGDDTSRDQPAMRTLLFGVAFVAAWYAAVAIAFVRWRGPVVALGALALIFCSAHADRLLRGRLRRATRRARAYLAFRADPALQPRVLAEIDVLLSDAIALERSLLSAPSDRDSSHVSVLLS